MNNNKMMVVMGKVSNGRVTTVVARENGTVAGYSRPLHRAVPQPKVEVIDMKPVVKEESADIAFKFANKQCRELMLEAEKQQAKKDPRAGWIKFLMGDSKLARMIETKYL